MGKYAEFLVTWLMGWTKTIFAWVLENYDKSISSSGWFVENWKWLAFRLLLLCIAIDIVIWFLRWRPYRSWVALIQKFTGHEDEATKNAPPEEPIETPLLLDQEQEEQALLPERSKPSLGLSEDMLRKVEHLTKSNHESSAVRPSLSVNSENTPFAQEPVTLRPHRDGPKDDLDFAIRDLPAKPVSQSPRQRHSEEDGSLFSIILNWFEIIGDGILRLLQSLGHLAGAGWESIRSRFTKKHK